jgi:hypothetical protein
MRLASGQAGFVHATLCQATGIRHYFRFWSLVAGKVASGYINPYLPVILSAVFARRTSENASNAHARSRLLNQARAKTRAFGARIDRLEAQDDIITIIALQP